MIDSDYKKLKQQLDQLHRLQYSKKHQMRLASLGLSQSQKRMNNNSIQHVTSGGGRSEYIPMQAHKSFLNYTRLISRIQKELNSGVRQIKYVSGLIQFLTEMKQDKYISGHKWSGWPGAWCLDCGVSDLDDSMEVLTDEEREAMEVCPEPGSDRHNPYVNKVEVRPNANEILFHSYTDTGLKLHKDLLNEKDIYAEVSDAIEKKLKKDQT